MRPFSEEAYAGLKRAVEVGLKLAGGTKLVAFTTRVNGSMLTRYGSSSAEHHELFMPVDVAIDLDTAAKHPVITGKMAEILGFHLVPKSGLPGTRRITDGDAVDIMSEAMDLVRAIQSARADDRICEADRKKIKIEIADLQRELHELAANLGEG